jgi:hypothetical protein
MKNIKYTVAPLLTLFLCSGFYFSQAQNVVITTDDKQMSGPKPNFGQVFVSVIKNQYVLDSSTHNKWDFTQLKPGIQQDTVFYLHPKNTPYQKAFPEANLAMTTDYMKYDYFKVSANSLIELGTVGVNGLSIKKSSFYLQEVKYLSPDTFLFLSNTNNPMAHFSRDYLNKRINLLGVNIMIEQYIQTQVSYTFIDSFILGGIVYLNAVRVQSKIDFTDSAYRIFGSMRSPNAIMDRAYSMQKEQVFCANYSEMLYSADIEELEVASDSSEEDAHYLTGGVFALNQDDIPFFDDISIGTNTNTLILHTQNPHVKVKIIDMNTKKKYKWKVSQTNNKVFVEIPLARIESPVIVKLELKAKTGSRAHVFSTAYIK